MVRRVCPKSIGVCPGSARGLPRGLSIAHWAHVVWEDATTAQSLGTCGMGGRNDRSVFYIPLRPRPHGIISCEDLARVFAPEGSIPKIVTKRRECWKFLD